MIPFYSFSKKMEVAVKSYSVKDLMVPLSEYATVMEDATLYDAVLSLEAAQEKFEDKHTRYRHRAILILDKDNNVIGKLSQLDVLKALEPKYQDMIEGEGSHRFGFTKGFMQSTIPWMTSAARPESSPSKNLCMRPPRANMSLKTRLWKSQFIS
jgi:hypothetical protein